VHFPLPLAWNRISDDGAGCWVLLLQVLQVVLQQRVERGGQQVLVQDFIGSSIGAQHVEMWAYVVEGGILYLLLNACTVGELQPEVLGSSMF
jgi:hypothetical protein